MLCQFARNAISSFYGELHVAFYVYAATKAYGHVLNLTLPSPTVITAPVHLFLGRR